ncbi:active breakpoint cluster region-related protein-like isoform X2 [Lytechinus variegatus]|uniref:active breakpoint cluster region-related protein-like isoform X2 n=1 Tax=Lytechinus variegatus TaxID=7654 RepID=UPI001BB1785D|nr:active breakpoint cluster region-related protein-like isoform X2 [Lytechinus variegatus]
MEGMDNGNCALTNGKEGQVQEDGEGEEQEKEDQVQDQEDLEGKEHGQKQVENVQEQEGDKDKEQAHDQNEFVLEQEDDEQEPEQRQQIQEENGNGKEEKQEHEDQVLEQGDDEQQEQKDQVLDQEDSEEEEQKEKRKEQVQEQEDRTDGEQEQEKEDKHGIEQVDGEEEEQKVHLGGNEEQVDGEGEGHVQKQGDETKEKQTQEQLQAQEDREEGKQKQEKVEQLQEHGAGVNDQHNNMQEKEKQMQEGDEQEDEEQGKSDDDDGEWDRYWSREEDWYLKMIDKVLSGALSSDSVSLSPSVDSVEDKDVDPAVIRPNDINITLTDNGQHNPSLDSPHSATTPSRVCGDVNDSIKLSTPEVEKLSIRRLLLGGILESEQKYIKSLEILQKVMKTFKASISTSTPVMTEEEYDTMFFRIPELLNVHRQFVHHMEPKMEHWTPEQMQGDSFKLLASHFDIHEEYIANYKRAMSTLQRLQTENELFRNIAQQALKLESGEMYTLEAMLYSPLQGITKLTMILNDLLKHTPEHHEDHSILSQVLEKTRKFFKQVDDATREIHSTKQKRELIRQGYLVEWTEGGRKLRRILLWSDLIICASKRNTSGMFQRDKGQYDFQWYIPLTELSLTPNDRCEAEPHVVAKSDSELRQMKKDISELQEKIKRDKAAKQSRAIQKSIDQKRKQIGELEVGYVLESPKLPFHLYHHSGKTYTILMSSDYERSDWKEAILTTKRECRMTPSITPYHISNSVLIPKTRRGRDSYVNISSVLLKDNDELLTGMLYVTVKEARGLTVPSQLYCCLETDAYGIFSRMAKTRKTSNTIKPKWNEEFALDVDGAKTLRILCYDFTKGLDDEMYDKGAVSLAKQEISVTGGKDFTILMDQLQVDVTVRFESSEKTLKRVHSRKKMGVFGVQVGTLAHRQGKNIPNIITLCVEEVDRRGIHEMGIYRISGSSADIQKLKKAFEITFHDLCEITESDRRNIASMLKQSDIHAVAGLLKAYLRELPEPLFTHALYPQFVDGLQLTDPVAKKKCFMSLLKSVVEPNRTIIFLLFNHLRRIAKEEEKNKMSLHNLSTVFGPTLLGPAATTNASGKPDILAEIMGMSSVISQVGILHYCLEHFSDTTELLETDL